MLIDEVTAKLQAGVPVDVEAYAQEHPEHAKALRRLLPALDLLADLGSSEIAGSVISAAALLPEDGITGTLGDFRILREVGRGGMGVVYEAEQISLGRRVALKVLPFAAALDPKQLQRFRNEAQAAAQLHHPHIVPVHAVGCERGVPFYAMQFIDGQTVAALIRELRQEARIEDRGSKAQGEAATVEDRGPGHDTRSCHPRSSILDPRSSFFRTVARLGVQAAEALEHAHQLGVVHRDIKPANLLVDGGGCLWITDFGLARFRGETNLTLTGDLLGTVRYMSPEQALGPRQRMDHRTDIYSLGATLYELLTLEPVHAGSDRQELLRQIGSVAPQPPRRLNPELPADLETIVLKALDKEPEGRYATAQELADDLRRFLEDKPIQARRPTLIQRARKWARRHKPVVAAGLAVLLMGVVAWALSTVLILRQRDEARAQRQLAQEQEQVAQAQREAAHTQRELARRAVDEMYTEVAEKWLANQPHLQEMQRRFLLKALQYYEAFAQESGTDPGLRHQAGIAYRRVGDIQSRLGKHAEAEAAYGRAIGVQAALVDVFPNRPEYRRELATCQNHLGLLVMELGRKAEAEQAQRRALAAWKQLVADFPTEPHDRGGLARSHNYLGIVLATTRRPEEAVLAFRLAVGLQEKLVAEVPAVAEYREELAESTNNLAALLIAGGQPQQAEEAHRRALALQERLVLEFPIGPRFRNGLARTRDHLARLLKRSGRPGEAEQLWRQALPLLERLAEEFPGAPEYRAQLARSHNNLAILLKEGGRPREAEQAYRRALALDEALAVEFPELPGCRHELALCHLNLGNLLRQDRRTDEAAQAYRQAAAVLERLAAAFPGTAEYRLHLAHSHTNLALLLEEGGRPREAEQALRQAVVQLERLAAESLKASSYRQGLALCLSTLGNLQRQTGRPDEAAQAWRQAVGWARQAVELAPRAGTCWTALGVAQYRAGQWQAAIEALHQSLELRTGGTSEDWLYLAMAHGQRGEKDQAQQWYDQACATLEQDQPADQQLLRLRAEAAAVLGLPPPAKP
jgi:serine/threonine protein kinase